MKKQDNVKLGVLSRIDEKILDKATETRFRLLMKKRRRGRAPLFYGVGAVAACLALILCAVFLIPLFTKQIPVYTGMTVSSAAPAVQGSAAIPAEAKGEVTLLSLPDYNPFATSYSLKTDNPHADEHGRAPVKEEIAKEVKNSLAVVGSAEDLYYATPNQDIYVTVHIDNPDQFEIQSFTLNGKKYSSYMFEDGSDMENLILKLNVGKTEGVVEYTIDAIKYIDGTEIKDVRLDGDRTVKVGVYTEKQPAAEIVGETVGISALSFEVTVTDELSLVALDEGKVAAILLDGETIVDYRILAVGEKTALTFEGLSPDHAYAWGIYAYYDALDGTGSNLYALCEKEIRTEKALVMNGSSAGKERIDFSFGWHEASTTDALQSLALYREDRLVRELSPDATSAEGLLSGFAYRLVATYLYGDRIETAEYSFTTEAKTAPTYEITAGAVTQTSIGFGITETDGDDIGAITKIELLHATQTARVGDANTRSFDGLLSGHEYTVKITYEYDLNDGTGVHTEAVTSTFRTEGKTEPIYDIITEMFTQTSVKFTIREQNPDQIGTITKIELLHATDSRTATDTDVRKFDGLLSNNEYTVKVTYTYDLNDGNGTQTKTVEKVFRTLEKTAPVYEIVDLTANQTKVDFSVTETDEDNIGTITKIELLHATQATRVGDANARSFDGLLSNNEYTVRITYTYDLNDGNGTQTKTVEKAIRTQAKTAPAYVIENLTATQTKVDFSVTETDEDNIGTITKIDLLHASEETRVATDNNIRSFDGLSSANVYTIQTTYTYDLNDGTGVQTETVVKEFATLARTITVTDLEITGKTTLAEDESTSLTITLNNPDNVSVTNLIINGVNITPSKAEWYGPNDYFIQKLTLPAGEILQLKVERIDYTVSTYGFSQSSDFQDDESIAWIGAVSLKDASAAGEKKYYNSNETVTVIYRFEGLENYTVFSIDSRPATKIDASTYSVSYGTRTGVGGIFTYYQCTIVYGISSEFQMQTSVSINEVTDSEYYSEHYMTYHGAEYPYMVWWFGPDVIDVSTPEQLQSMTENKAYRLVKDIDLSGFDWESYMFTGVLYGNGYEIKNLTLTEEHAYERWDDHRSLGLFENEYRGSGLSFYDVRLTNLKVNITVKPGEKPIHVMIFGSDDMNGFYAYDCYVEGTIIYHDLANAGTSIYCTTKQECNCACRFDGTVVYNGSGDLWINSCGGWRSTINGDHYFVDEIPAACGSVVTLYINGVQQ